jgi:hypothetical protein
MSSSGRWPAPHNVESDVRYRLESEPGLKVHALVVRRTPGGVCLEGRVEVLDPQLSLAKLLAGVDAALTVENRLIVCACQDPYTLETDESAGE